MRSRYGFVLAIGIVALLDFRATAAEPKSDRFEAIRQKLRDRVNLDGWEPNTPLGEALDFIAERYGIKIHVDAPAIQKSGIEDLRKAPVGLPKVFNMPLGRMLELLLAQVGRDKDVVRYRLRPDGIEITSARGSTIVPGTRRVLKPGERNGDKISVTLQGRLQTPVNLDGFEANTPLKEGLGFLSERYDVSIFMDIPAFERIGIKEPQNQPVQMPRIVNVPLVHVLWHVLAQCHGRLRMRGSYVEVVPADDTGMNLAFSPDGRFLATVSHAGSAEHLVRVWDRRFGREIQSISLPCTNWSQLAFTPRNKLAVCWTDSDACRLAVWDALTREKESEDELDDVEGIFTLAPDGQSYACADSGTLHVRNLQTGKERTQAVPDDLASLSFSGDGRTLVALDRQPAPLQMDDPNPGDVAVRHIQPSRALLCKTGGGGSVHFRMDDSRGGEVEGLAMTSANLSRDGRLLAAIDAVGRLELWETLSGRRIRALRTGAMVQDVAFSPDGRQLAAILDIGAQPTVEVWDLPSGRSLGWFEAESAGQLLALAFAPDGRSLAAAAEDGTPIVWNLADLAKRRPETSLTPERLKALWTQLMVEDGERGYQALCDLEAGHAAAVPFLQGKLKPFVSPKEAGFDALLRQLDDDEWGRRNEAERTLLRLGKQVEPRLRRELQRPRASLESRRRIERIVGRFQQPVASVETLRELRAIQVLESAGTDEARRILKTLADGNDSETTHAARVALERVLKP